MATNTFVTLLLFLGAVLLVQGAGAIYFMSCAMRVLTKEDVQDEAEFHIIRQAWRPAVGMMAVGLTIILCVFYFR